MFEADLDKILEVFFFSLEDDELEDFADVLDKWWDITQQEIDELGDK